jgi:hypothetical protein
MAFFSATEMLLAPQDLIQQGLQPLVLYCWERPAQFHCFTAFFTAFTGLNQSQCPECPEGRQEENRLHILC